LDKHEHIHISMNLQTTGIFHSVNCHRFLPGMCFLITEEDLVQKFRGVYWKITTQIMGCRQKQTMFT